MAEAFLTLSEADRTDALGVAADASGRPAYLLEKDVWVVWSLEALFGTAFGEHLVFKGGTSLSKAHRAISRFSEDVDVTYDVRALLPELAGGVGEPLPATKSQEKKWSELVRKRLPAWTASTVLPALQAHREATGVQAEFHMENDRLLIRYQRVIDIYADYVAPAIQIEFGGRSTGEPARPMPVVCDAAAYVPALAFPAATPRVMTAERTFWEKATAIHVFCLEERLRGDRFARHWYDLVRLDETGFATRALADRDLANAVALHKSWFFATKDTTGQLIDYAAAVSGSLCLVPDGNARATLKEDYQRMIDAGLLEETPTPFDELMARCASLEERANGRPRAGGARQKEN